MNAMGCSIEKAREFKNAYAQGFPGVTDFKAKGEAFVKSHGYILIDKLTGLKIHWYDWNKWKRIESMSWIERQSSLSGKEQKEHNSAGAKWGRLALNSPTQGTGAELIKYAAARFFGWIRDNGYFNKVLLCNMVHDEIVIEYPAELVDIVVPQLQFCMEDSAKVFCKQVPIPAEPATGDHWIH